MSLWTALTGVAMDTTASKSITKTLCDCEVLWLCPGWKGVVPESWRTHLSQVPWKAQVLCEPRFLFFEGRRCRQSKPGQTAQYETGPTQAPLPNTIQSKSVSSKICKAELPEYKNGPTPIPSLNPFHLPKCFWEEGEQGTGNRRQGEEKPGDKCWRLICLEDNRIEKMTKNAQTSPRSGNFTL